MNELMKSFAKDVLSMREAQKKYFRTRSAGALQEAKLLERRVDEAVKQILDEPGKPDGQQMLF